MNTWKKISRKMCMIYKKIRNKRRILGIFFWTFRRIFRRIHARTFEEILKAILKKIKNHFKILVAIHELAWKMPGEITWTFSGRTPGVLPKEVSLKNCLRRSKNETNKIEKKNWKTFREKHTMKNNRNSNRNGYLFILSIQ